jgi:hypothetical protein
MVYENGIEKRAREAAERQAAIDKKNAEGAKKRRATEQRAIKSSAEWAQKHSATGRNTMVLLVNPLKLGASADEQWVAHGAGWALVNTKTKTIVIPARQSVVKTDATKSGHIVIPVIGNGASLQLGRRVTKVREGDYLPEVEFEADTGAISSLSLIKSSVFGETKEDEAVGIRRGISTDKMKTFPNQFIDMDNGKTGVIGADGRVRALTAAETQAQGAALASYSKDFRNATHEQAKWNNLVGLVTTLTVPAGAAFSDNVVMKQVYTRQLTKQIAKQPVVYRYLTEKGYQDALKYDSIASYATTKFSKSSSEVMQGAQIAESWGGKVKYRVEIPVDKLRGFAVPRPKGNKGWYWWETKAWSYPEYGKGQFQQFIIGREHEVPLKDVIIKKLELE